jgi:hypothetical protein
MTIVLVWGVGWYGFPPFFGGRFLLKEDVPSVCGRMMTTCDVREKGLLVLFCVEDKE